MHVSKIHEPCTKKVDLGRSERGWNAHGIQRKEKLGGCWGLREQNPIFVLSSNLEWVIKWQSILSLHTHTAP